MAVDSDVWCGAAGECYVRDVGCGGDRSVAAGDGDGDGVLASAVGAELDAGDLVAGEAEVDGRPGDAVELAEGYPFAFPARLPRRVTVLCRCWCVLLLEALVVVLPVAVSVAGRGLRTLVMVLSVLATSAMWSVMQLGAVTAHEVGLGLAMLSVLMCSWALLLSLVTKTTFWLRVVPSVVGLHLVRTFLSPLTGLRV